jgi:hypothetical protein
MEGEAMERFDLIRFDASRARKTADGWIIDRPVVTRAGVFVYRNADGTTRREFRPPEEVFHADHLASMQGVPVTTAENHNRLLGPDEEGAVIGTMLSPGVRVDAESMDVAADIVIHHPSRLGTRRELSLGYRIARLDMTPGEWQGQRYDCVQRGLTVNHCAVVPQGRAGNARLRLDAQDAVSGEIENLDIERMDSTMAEQAPRTVNVRLDSGLEYPAAPEVAVAMQARLDRIAQLERDLTAANTRADSIAAERDTIKMQVEGHKAELEKVRTDAAAEVRSRITLEETARKHGVSEIRADMADRAIREAVISKLNGPKTEGQTDAYVAVAFDMAVAAADEANKALGNQRAAIGGVMSQTRSDAAPSGNPMNPPAGGMVIRNAKDARDFAIRAGNLY